MTQLEKKLITNTQNNIGESQMHRAKKPNIEDYILQGSKIPWKKRKCRHGEQISACQGLGMDREVDYEGAS